MVGLKGCERERRCCIYRWMTRICLGVVDYVDRAGCHGGPRVGLRLVDSVHGCVPCK